jgi:hypothetical protein
VSGMRRRSGPRALAGRTRRVKRCSCGISGSGWTVNDGNATESEYKLPLRLKQAFQQLCAMVNAEAAEGQVIFGADNTGKVIGLA